MSAGSSSRDSAGQESAQPSAPPCGVYVRISDEAPFEDTVAKLRQLFFVATRSAYEKNMHVIELPGYAENAARAEEIKGLITLVQQNGFVAILRRDIGRTGEWKADGVLLESVNDIEIAREALGADMILGVNARTSRFVAEKALEAGIDYVVFGAAGKMQLPPVDLFSWWSTRTDVPSLAAGPITNDDCAPLVAAGATFIDATSFIMNHPDGVMQGATDMLYAIDLAAKKIEAN